MVQIMPKAAARFMVLGAWLAATRVAVAGAVLESHWYELLLDDVKAGWMSVIVHDEGDHYRTVTESLFRMRRGPQSVQVESRTDFVETQAGEPVEVTHRQDMSAQVMSTHWRFDDDHIVQTVQQGGRETTRTLPRPTETWLTPVAADRFARERRDAGAEVIRYRILDPENGPKPMSIESTRAGKGVHEVDGREIPITIWRTVTDVVPMEVTEHYSRDGHLVYQELPLGLGCLLQLILFLGLC